MDRNPLKSPWAGTGVFRTEQAVIRMGMVTACLSFYLKNVNKA